MIRFKGCLVPTVLLLLLFLLTSPAQAAGPDITAPAAILMEVQTGEIIFAKNEHDTHYPASITKIMTMLLIMEAIYDKKVSLQDDVTVSQWAAHMGGSQIWLETGEKMKFIDMLKAVAIASANDASVALAEYIYGSEQSFVKAMNEKAKELGLKNTIYYNCTGLPGTSEKDSNITTAYDIALVSRALLQYPEILKLTSIWIDHVRDGKNVLNNTNRLVRHFPGVDGIKTGFTNEAKFCLSATGVRDNVRLIAVVMKAPTSATRFDEISTLLTYGFGRYKGVPIVKKGEHIKDIPLEKGRREYVAAVVGKDLIIPVKRGSEENFKRTIQWNTGLAAPLKKGDPVGLMIIEKDDKEVGRVNLVAGEDMPKGSYGNLMKQLMKGFFRNLYNVGEKEAGELSSCDYNFDLNKLVGIAGFDLYKQVVGCRI